MDLAIAENPRFQSTIPGRVWVGVALITAGAGVAGLLGYWWLVFVPLGLTAMLVCVLQPSVGLYFLIGTLFFPYPIIHSLHTYPADLTVLFIVVGFLLRRAANGEPLLVHTPIDKTVLVWLAILTLSLVNAYDLQRGIVNLIRHFQLFLLFYCIVDLAGPRTSRRLLRLLVMIAAFLAIFNIIPYLQSGGAIRVYGVARISFNTILMVVIVYLTARVCFESNKKRALLYAGLLGIALLGQMANQSRAAIALSGIGMIITFIVAWKWPRSGQSSLPRTRVKQLAAVGLTLIVIGIFVGVHIFHGLTERFMGVGNAATTLHFREFIWKTAVSIYLDHPILGIGLAQVQVWEHIVPSLRLAPLGPVTFGLGSHLSFLKYLAECGTVGAVVLLWLLWKIVRMTFVVFKRSRILAHPGHEIGVGACALVIVLRTFVEGHLFYAVTGMITVLFWGILTNVYSRLHDGRP